MSTIEFTTEILSGKSIVKASESYNDKLDMDNFLITFDQKGYEAKLSNYGKHIDIVLSDRDSSRLFQQSQKRHSQSLHPGS